MVKWKRQKILERIAEWTEKIREGWDKISFKNQTGSTIHPKSKLKSQLKMVIVDFLIFQIVFNPYLFTPSTSSSYFYMIIFIID